MLFGHALYIHISHHNLASLKNHPKKVTIRIARKTYRYILHTNLFKGHVSKSRTSQTCFRKVGRQFLGCKKLPHFLRLCWTWAFRSYTIFCHVSCTWIFFCCDFSLCTMVNHHHFRRIFFWGSLVPSIKTMQISKIYTTTKSPFHHTLALSPHVPHGGTHAQAVQGVYQRAKSLEMRIQACCSFFGSQVGARFLGKKNRTKNGDIFSPTQTIHVWYTCVYHRNQPNVGKYTLHG